jgi:hypothetical protein
MNKHNMTSPLPLATVQTTPASSGLTKPPFSLAWAAGFVDGEGCITIVKQRYQDPRRKFTYRLCLSISQNNLEVLEHLRDGLGITDCLYKTKRLLQHNKQMYALNLTGKGALAVIIALYPYLVRKRPEAQTAMDYWRHGQCGKHPGPRGWSASVNAYRESCFKKLKALK